MVLREMNAASSSDQPAINVKKVKTTTSKKPIQVWPIFQIKISLRGIKPLIWRRLIISSRCTLKQLHSAIQYSMGWGNSHLHMFIIEGIAYGTASDDIDESPTEDESKVRLGDLFSTPKSKFKYEYDFGDSWLHEILIEKVNVATEQYPGYPVCIGGARACPPEDCGGVPGYCAILEALEDPERLENEEALDFIGPDFDPSFFDLHRANVHLKRIKC